MLVLVVYSAVLVFAGVIEFKKNSDMETFAVAGRSSSSITVTISLVASCIGGSATIGLTALSWQVGFPSFWYLGSGVVGLIILSLFLAKKIQDTGAKSLPEMVERFISPEGRSISAIIIMIAWIAILAAQFSAASRIISSLTGVSYSKGLLYGAILITLYTVLGGQLSVMKSDLIQYIIIFLTLLIVIVYLTNNYHVTKDTFAIEFLNENFTISKWSYFMLIIGGSYVICPMLFSRLLSAKSKKSAKKSSLIAAPILLLTAIMIVTIGLICKSFLDPATDPDHVLTTVLISELPNWMGILLLLALFSAIISSADSCLITASTVFTNDIVKRDSVRVCRIVSILISIIALILSSRARGILSLLFAANDIFVCGIVTPVFISMLVYGKKRMSRDLTLLAMIIGGSFGLIAAITGSKIFTFWGVLASVVISLSSIKLESFTMGIIGKKS